MVQVRNTGNNPINPQSLNNIGTETQVQQSQPNQQTFQNQGIGLGLRSRAGAQNIGGNAQATPVLNGGLVGNNAQASVIAANSGSVNAGGATPAASDNARVVETLQGILGPIPLTDADLQTLAGIQQHFSMLVPPHSTETIITSNTVIDPNVKQRSLDEAHSGNLLVKGHIGASYDFSAIPEGVNKLDFLTQNLAFGSRGSGRTLFINGLNTFTRDIPGEQTTTQRADVFQKNLDDYSVLNMALGTTTDQGEAVIPFEGNLQLLLGQLEPQLRDAGLYPEIKDGNAIFAPRQRDRIEAVLSQRGLIDTAVKMNLREVVIPELLNSDSKPIEIMGYSRGAGEVQNFVKQTKKALVDTFMGEGASEGAAIQRAQEVMGKKLTIVTFGNTGTNWEKGPAYLMVSSYEDPLTSQNGVHYGSPAEAKTDNMAFLHFNSPYKGFDAHNLHTGGVEAIELAMRKTGVGTMRELQQAIMEGRAQFPTADEVRARIQQTGSYENLWTPDVAWGGRQNVLPTPEGSNQILAGVPPMVNSQS